MHADDSELSFNLLLSEPSSFEGGGTSFITNLDELAQTPGMALDDAKDVARVCPQRGEMLSHFGRLYHAGTPVTRGTRHILAGFVGVESLAANWRVLRPQTMGPTEADEGEEEDDEDEEEEHEARSDILAFRETE